MSESTKAVFLSYASQDADAARRICDALRAAGLEVWFDQNELRGGDAWDASIRRQIKDCALFVPIVSANTQAREEGYFRREWNLAVNRTLDMAQDKAFLLPVVIDGTGDATARVPDKFRDVQWTRLPGGESAEPFAERVCRLLGATAPAAPATAQPAARAAGGGCPLHRRAAFREPEPRRGERVLRRRAGRGAPQRHRQGPRPARRGAHLVLQLQGQGRGHPDDRPRSSTWPPCSKAACARPASACA